jgi:uncharacterized membrane-anchored protein
MNRKLALFVFILMIAAQWYIPTQAIFSAEEVINQGEMFKFVTAPVDPVDPFRGNFVRLSFDANEFSTRDVEHLSKGDQAYVKIGKNRDGFAQIEDLSRMPEGGTYIPCTIEHIGDQNPPVVRVSYAFDRFFMEESKAPISERLFTQAQSAGGKTTYALVAIKDGEAILTDVMIDGVSLKDLSESEMDDVSE